MKLVKEVRYGEKLIKRIYLGYDVIYDPHTFILKYGHGILSSTDKAFGEGEIPTDSGMICAVDMYVISAPEIFDEPGISSKAQEEEVVLVCAVGTLDGIVDAEGHGFGETIETVAEGVSSPTQKMYVISDDDGVIVAEGVNSPTRILSTQCIDFDVAEAYGKSSPTIKAYVIEDSIGIAQATGLTIKLMDTFANDNNLVVTSGYGQNRPTIKIYMLEDDIAKVIGYARNKPSIKTNTHGIFESNISSAPSTDIDMPINSHSEFTIEVEASGDYAPTKNSAAHGDANIISGLKVEDVAQANTHAHGDASIITSFGDINIQQIDTHVHSTIATTIKSKPDQSLPHNVGMSGIIHAQTQASSMKWHMPKQDGDTLFIFQAYETTYNEEIGTLEII